jgi:hypothetical protein
MSDYGQEKRMRDARMARQLLGMAALRKQECFRDKQECFRDKWR